MNKHINFEDTIFILNIRIKMVRDLLQLDTDARLFLQKTMEDLDFIGFVLDTLVDKLIAGPEFPDWELNADNLSEIEWQYSQLLNEYSGSSSPFSTALFPETTEWVCKLKEGSEKRRKLIDTSFVPAEHSQVESVVSQAELSGLLSGL